MRPVIIGTAGHIDHGKTSLVKALTGTNTDRLKEEQERGITIDIGFAFLTDDIAFIDVPGHERFIKNMVAGVATVDFVCLVVAADDGIMPQTREHFDIVRLLGVEDGLVAVTKIDMADPEWVDMVEADVRDFVRGSFLEGRPIVRVDSLSGRGIDGLKAEILALAGRKKEAPQGPIFRLPVDRVFSVKGFGTVVTGSALSGVVAVEDRLEVLPRGAVVRVRGIESQGQKAESASAGMRVALNLPQIAVDEVERGDVIATPGRLRPTFMLDAEVHVLERSPSSLKQRQRVRVHVGTKEVMGRVVILGRDRIEPGEDGLVQLRLEERTVASRLDRFVLRRYSPPLTIAGGRVLDANPAKHRKRHSEAVVGALRSFGGTGEEDLVLKILEKTRIATFEELLTGTGMPASLLDDLIGRLTTDDLVVEFEAKGARRLCRRVLYDDFAQALGTALGEFHARNPLKAGAKRGEILARAAKDLPDFLARHFLEMALAGGQAKSLAGDLLALHDFEVRLDRRQRLQLDVMEDELRRGAFEPPDLAALASAHAMDEKAARQLLQVLVDSGKALNLDGKIYFHSVIVAEGVARLKTAFAERSELTMSDFRLAVGTTRKYAVPLLNHYDGQGYTVRRGDVRVPGPRLSET
ncbi:MAG: selenocysteine-specific translation elongation factor [Deltaproteobacteria bacterium]|nr:selenocysteine-specific translation elongation factor [Deltaproteobacteria bacterium]